MSAAGSPAVDNWQTLEKVLKKRGFHLSRDVIDGVPRATQRVREIYLVLLLRFPVIPLIAFYFQ